MKRLFFLVIAISFVSVALGQAPGPLLTWEKSSHDFGDIVQGDKVEVVFKYKNTGNEPLLITNVQVTCGCTTPKGWARDPIAPGQGGELTVAFNSLGKLGKQRTATDASRY